jgi:hypothetical protein
MAMHKEFITYEQNGIRSVTNGLQKIMKPSTITVNAQLSPFAPVTLGKR